MRLLSEHTPTPWQYQERSDAYTHIIRSGDRFIAQLTQDSKGRAEADARLIVKAVNAHEILVKALTDILDASLDPYEIARQALARTAAQGNGDVG
jgi:hypothetical protein